MVIQLLCPSKCIIWLQECFRNFHTAYLQHIRVTQCSINPFESHFTEKMTPWFWHAELIKPSRQLVEWINPALEVGWEDQNTFYNLFLDFIARKLNIQLNHVLFSKNNFHLLNKVRIKIFLCKKGTFSFFRQFGRLKVVEFMQNRIQFY